jgi:hypothetical protein
MRQPGYHSAGKHFRPYGFASLSFDRFALIADNSIVIYNNITIILLGISISGFTFIA